MTTIAAVASALPAHFYDQETLLDRLEREWGGRHFNTERLRRLHENVLVGGRHLALPLERYDDLDTFGRSNDAWIEVALDLGARAVEQAIEQSGIDRGRIGSMITVSVTGLAVPSLDARLMNRIELPRDLRRVPIFGLGCVAGAAGVARAADYVRAYPEQAAVLLSVELCSLTLQREDLSVPNLIASGLFGDGAAAVVVCGEELAGASVGPRIVASTSVTYPDSERVMGWDISERGFGIVLASSVPDVVRRHLRADVDGFLARQGLSLEDIESFVCHPGGPKVLQAMQESLDLDESALELTWRSLREVGNLSSTSVLMVLEETMRARRPAPGSHGLLLAMGPGFCSELVLLRW